MKRFVILLSLFVLTSLSFLWMFHRMEMVAGISGMLDVQVYYTPESARQFLSALGKAGRSIYLQALMIDLLYPIIYALLLRDIMRFALNRLSDSSPQWLRTTVVLPFAVAALDYLENLGEFLMIIRYPHFSPTLARITSRVTMLKWSGVLLILGLIALLFTVFRKRTA